MPFVNVISGGGVMVKEEGSHTQIFGQILLCGIGRISNFRVKKQPP